MVLSNNLSLLTHSLNSETFRASTLIAFKWIELIESGWRQRCDKNIEKTTKFGHALTWRRWFGGFNQEGRHKVVELFKVRSNDGGHRTKIIASFHAAYLLLLHAGPINNIVVYRLTKKIIVRFAVFVQIPLSLQDRKKFLHASRSSLMFPKFHHPLCIIFCACRAPICVVTLNAIEQVYRIWITTQKNVIKQTSAQTTPELISYDDETRRNAKLEENESFLLVRLCWFFFMFI